MIAVEDEPERQCDSVVEIARKPRAIITDRLKTLSRVIRSLRRQASERSGMLGRRGPEQFEFFAGWLRDLIPDDHILVRVDLVLDLPRLRGKVAELYCPDHDRSGGDLVVIHQDMVSPTRFVHQPKLGDFGLKGRDGHRRARAHHPRHDGQ
jgi:hypothetical protein